MADNSIVAILVAVLGSGGLAAVIRSVTSSIKMHRQGIAGKEERRREDIVKQRDEAFERARLAEHDAHAEERRADQERERRIRWQEESARLRIALIMAGKDPGAPPIDEDTIKPTHKE